MDKILQFFNLDQKINWRIEILAGLTVAMTMIPESLSFAILAGFPPLSGLYAAFIAGLVAAMFGGRPYFGRRWGYCGHAHRTYKTSWFRLCLCCCGDGWGYSTDCGNF